MQEKRSLPPGRPKAGERSVTDLLEGDGDEPEEQIDEVDRGQQFAHALPCRHGGQQLDVKAGLDLTGRGLGVRNMVSSITFSRESQIES